ncbi:MAG: aromatic-ring-hydroxylating dioxygenase subunit beta [Gammaproteobacteria bacterium]|nr:aromatic-ring-hydroxylating dioxygenase subunit beta [Gammaproteobacteria bacterium]
MLTASKNEASDLREIEAFLYREADLLDAGNLRAWRDLFTEDGTYWLPVSADQDDPLGHISIIYEDKMMMAIRAENFGHRLAASMQYAVRSSHIVANTRLQERSADGSEIVVKSNFQAVIYYRTQSVYAGTCTHKLRREESDWRIVQKRVDLINCDADHKSIVIYI